MKHVFKTKIVLGRLGFAIGVGGEIEIADDNASFVYRGITYTDMRDINICLDRGFCVPVDEIEKPKKENIKKPKKEKVEPVIEEEVKVSRIDGNFKITSSDDTSDRKIISLNEKAPEVESEKNIGDNDIKVKLQGKVGESQGLDIIRMDESEQTGRIVKTISDDNKPTEKDKVEVKSETKKTKKAKKAKK